MFFSEIMKIFNDKIWKLQFYFEKFTTFCSVQQSFYNIISK